MDIIRETVFDHVAGENFVTVSTSESTWISRLQKLKANYPDDISIRHINTDGSLIAQIPKDWLKVKPKKKYSEEYIAAARERMRIAREKRSGSGAILDNVEEMMGK